MSTPITKHRCDFCGKDFASKSYANKHEVICFNNPDSKSCITCDHLQQDLTWERSCKINVESLKFRLHTNCSLHKSL